MESYLLGIISEGFELIYILFPVISLTILAHRLTSETGRRTGSTLFFFSFVFYLLATFEALFITVRFGIIVSQELVILQILYLFGGILLAGGVLVLYRFFIKLADIDKKLYTKEVRTPLFISLVYISLFIPYALIFKHAKFLYFLTDLFYILIQSQFFFSYFLVGSVMYTNQFICPKAPKRSKQIKVISFYYLVEPIIWLASLNSNLQPIVLDRIFFATEIMGALASGFITFNILHILISHAPLLLKEGRSPIVTLKFTLFKRLTAIAVITGVGIIAIAIYTTSILFDVQERIFLERKEKEFEIIRVFARESVKEIENLSAKLQILAQKNAKEISRAVKGLDLKFSPFKDTIAGLKEKHSSVASNVFIYDPYGKIVFSHPETLTLTLPEDAFSRQEPKLSRILKTDDKNYSIFLTVPTFDASRFIGGVGVEVNIGKIRESIERLLERSPHIIIADSEMKIISAEDKDLIGVDFIKNLKSYVDDAESINFITVQIPLLKGEKNFTARVFHNSRRAILSLSIIPLKINSDRVFIADRHFSDEFTIFEMVPPSVFASILIGSTLLILMLIAILYVNLTFSEHLEYEVERRAVELAKSEEKYRSIVENPFFGAYIVDASGFKYVNDRFCEIFGYSRAELLTMKDYFVLIHPEDREKLMEQLRKRLKGEIELNRWEARGIRKDGSVIHIHGYSKRIEYEGKPASQGMILDVTNEIKRREVMEQAQRLESLGTLASGIAHDFNNLLQIILGAAQLLKLRVQDATLMKWIDSINTTAIRGAELAKRLLTFSRKKPTGEMKRLDLHKMIEEAVVVFRETFPRNIELIHELNAEKFTILGEEAQVQQIIFNLSVNAKDAMTKGGKLIFRTENRKGNGSEGNENIEYIVMHVIDTGIGMTEEVKRRIFEPFFTTKPPGKGTGLGLSTVYGIVKSYGGFIKVYSELGKGTKFSIYLPIATEEQQTETGEKKPIMKKTGTILIIDDEEDIRFTTKELLESSGFKVYTASDGQEGINIYKEKLNEIDVVILDLNMPKMSGKETLAHLLLINPNAKVLVATGYITEEEKEEVKHVAGYIEKPFDFDKLLEMLGSLL